jgi:hypothetical protein
MGALMNSGMILLPIKMKGFNPNIIRLMKARKRAPEPIQKNSDVDGPSSKELPGWVSPVRERRKKMMVILDPTGKELPTAMSMEEWAKGKKKDK